MTRVQICKLVIALLLVFICIACLPSTPELGSSSLNTEKPSLEILSDCFITFYLSAWVDMDEDGVWDASEPSLQGVEFRIDGRFASVLSKYPCSSDQEGRCRIMTWAPGECQSGEYKITAVPPESYQPTTPASINLSLTSTEFSREAQFGFVVDQ
jgi:hypothetical protein